MNDKHYKENKLWAYLDGDLNTDERAAIQNHISYCESCQLLLNELKSFDNELAQTVVEEPSMRFSKNVMELIEEEVTTTYAPIIPPFWRKLIATGMITLVVAVFSIPLLTPVQSFSLFGLEIGATHTLMFTHIFSILENPLVQISAASLGAFWLLFVADKFILSKRLR
jgi:anti-sigma factor RsiW